MKYYIVVFALGLATLGLMSLKNSKTKANEGNEGIKFEQSNWTEVLKKAKKENKIVFLDIYASWCGPCKMLKKTTFSNDNVGDFYNQKFINVAVDAEIGEGATLAQKYNVSGFPTLLFIKPDGSIHTKTMGYHTPNQFLELGNSVLSK